MLKERPQRMSEIKVIEVPQHIKDGIRRNLGIACMPWWRKDRFGWPIETFKGKPFQSLMRIICQNIRKVTP